MTERLKALKRSDVERFGTDRFKETVLWRRVPKTPWYHGDGAALTTLFAIQVITGVTMTLYYTNAADYAYQAVRYITYTQPMGRLVRGIHYWTAGTMVVVLFLHVFRHLLFGGYKAPREGTWTVGVFQFFLVLTMSFTGYLLRWDERAIYAIRVVLNMFHNVPLIGNELALFLQDGPRIGSTTLTRFFSIHTFIVPVLLAGLISYHLYLVVVHGITSEAEQKHAVESAEEQKKIYKRASKSEEHGEWFYPATVLLTGAMAFLVFSIAYVLALVAGPQELYPEANLVERSMPMEEWWFAWYSSLVALLPPAVAPTFEWAFGPAVFIAMLLLPLLDRGPNRGIGKRPFWVIFVSFCVISLLYLSDLRLKSPWTGWPDPNPPPLPIGVVVGEEAEMGRKLFARYGCNSCHAVSSHGRKVGPDFAEIEHRLSPSEMYDYILSPPESVSMPSYRGRISEADLERVVQFVLAAQTFPRE